MTDSPCVVYRARDDTFPEAEVATLANIYAFALQKQKDMNEATRPGSPDDGTKGKGDSASADYTRT